MCHFTDRLIVFSMPPAHFCYSDQIFCDACITFDNARSESRHHGLIFLDLIDDILPNPARSADPCRRFRPPSCDPPRRAPAQAPVSAALLPRPSPGSQPPGEPMPSYQAVLLQPLHPSMLLLFQEPASSQTFPDLGIPQ